MQIQLTALKVNGNRSKLDMIWMENVSWNVNLLWCTLVVAHLQVQLAFMSAQLLIGECSFILVCHFGSQTGSIVFWMLLSLIFWKKKKNKNKTKNQSKCVKCQEKRKIGNEFKMLTRRANEYNDNVTWGTFRRSNKSAVWKISSSGNPYFLTKAWKRCTFSINWKFVPRSWIFFTDPGVSLLANLHKTTPSFKISS